MKQLNLFFIFLILQVPVLHAESEKKELKNSDGGTLESRELVKIPITLYYKNSKTKPEDFDNLYLLNKDKIILGKKRFDQPIAIKINEVAQIILNNNKEGKKGIVLKSGTVLSGNVEEYDKDSSQWKIALFGQEGCVTLKGLDQIKSINLLETGSVVGGESRSPADAISVLEWTYDPANGQPFGKQGGFEMNITKIALMANKIEVKANFFSDNEEVYNHPKGCYLYCTAKDNIGNTYKIIEKGKVNIPSSSASIEEKEATITCPKPKSNATSITLLFRNYYGHCGNTKWKGIPSINLELLK